MSIESLARPEVVRMKPYSSARKEAPGKGILLNANEAPRALLTDDSLTAELNRYPDPQPEALLDKLSNLYGVRKDSLLVTRGSDEGIDLLTRVFCRAGTDAILHCPPTFGMYRIAAQSQGADIVAVARQRSAGYRLDGQAVLDSISNNPSIRLVFLTSPNNPTGDSIGEETVTELLQACRGQALVVVDEAYAEFSQQPSFARLVAEHENLVVLRTLSKAWASAGLRCGSVIAQPVVIDLLKRVIAPYPLPSPVVSLALGMLQPDVLEKQKVMLQDMKAAKQALLNCLDGRSFVNEMFPGEANFVLFSTPDADQLLSFCAQRDIILRGFPADPELQDCIRISVGTTDEIRALSDALDAWENTR